MKKQYKWVTSLLLCFMVLGKFSTYSQTITTNRNIVGMEHNLLFGATSRFTVTQTGTAKLDLNRLFDGKFVPSYSHAGVVQENPTIVLIEDLPNTHTQAGAIVGWSTRYWNANRFKIEGYNVYGTEGWKTISDYSQTNYARQDFQTPLPSGSYTKLKFTFYSSTGSDGRLGVSELFFLHPEATMPYYGLSYAWELRGSDVYRRSGNVGIGKKPDTKLDVAGTIRATEIKVTAQTADFVFEPDYELRPLDEVEVFVKENKHLPEIPSAKQMEAEGVNVAEMNKLLLQKVEELTLYMIAMKKAYDDMQKEMKELKQTIEK